MYNNIEFIEYISYGIIRSVLIRRLRTLQFCFASNNTYSLLVSGVYVQQMHRIPIRIYSDNFISFNRTNGCHLVARVSCCYCQQQYRLSYHEARSIPTHRPVNGCLFFKSISSPLTLSPTIDRWMDGWIAFTAIPAAVAVSGLVGARRLFQFHFALKEKTIKTNTKLFLWRTA